MSETPDPKEWLPFVLGAIVDYTIHLSERDQPLVVGKDYPRDKLIEEITLWATKRNVDLQRIDRNVWLGACEQGRLK